MKDVLKLVLAILIVLAILGGIAYMLLERGGQYAEKYATGTAKQEMAREGMDMMKDIVGGRINK